MAGTTNNHHPFDDHPHQFLHPFAPSSSAHSTRGKSFSIPTISPIHEQTNNAFIEDQKPVIRSSKRRSIGKGGVHSEIPFIPQFEDTSLSNNLSFNDRYSSNQSNDFEGELDMPISRTAKRLAALGQLEGNNSESKNEWWENVLPPGQLAERLRRAQPNGPSSSTATMRSIVEDSDKNSARHCRKSILLSSTDGNESRSPDQHKIKTNSTNSSSSSPMLLSPPSHSSSMRERTGTWSSQSSTHGSHSTFSTRSSMSIGELSSSNSSNDEGQPERRSPIMADEWTSLQSAFGDRNSGSTSPTSITRSKSSRRRRCIGSDTGLGLGVAIRGATGSVIDLDERLGQWSEGYQFGSKSDQPTSPFSSAPALRPFPSSRVSVSGSYLSDTPEHSSAEEDHLSHRNLRPYRTSSTRTTDTVCENNLSRTKAASLASAPSSRRSSITASGHNIHIPSRRVSFSQEVQVVQSNDMKPTQTIGRAHGRSISTLSDRFGTGPNIGQPFPAQSERVGQSNGESRQRFLSSSLRANGEASKRTSIPSHLRGKRSTCYSAPTSPKLANMQMSEIKERQSSKLSRESTPNSSGRSTPRTARSRRNSVSSNASNHEVDADIVRMARLNSSLDIANSQLSSARTLAMALTRQLSAPLRPFFHLTLLVSISSAAFIALAGFLVAGYMCTVWDDVGSRGKSLQSNVHSAKKTIESRVKWTRALLGYTGSEQEASTDDSESFLSSNSSKSNKSSDTASSTSTEHQSDSTSAKTTRVIAMPFRLAFGLPFTVAYNLTPDVVRNAFDSPAKANPEKSKTAAKEYKGSANGPSGSKRTFSRRTTRSTMSNESNEFHNLPPRPPLSSLLPSIAFTIVIAFGAGLASFFANRAATTPTTGEAGGSSIPTTNRANSRASFHASTATSSASARRHSHAHHYHRFDQSSSGNKGFSTFPASSSPYVRPRSSHSFSSVAAANDAKDVKVGISSDSNHQHHHSRHSSTGMSNGNSGRRSPYGWQGVSVL